MPYPSREPLEERITHPDSAIAQPASNRGKDLRFTVRETFVIAILMASMAGYINSAMLIEFGLPVSQMTGVASQLSDVLAHLDASELLIPLMILGGFIFGAFMSGFMIGRAHYQTTASYGHALLLNSAILASATALSFLQSELSLLLSAIACGLQNALVASYRGLQMRTTHMTGIVTDLGVHLAHRLQSREPWPWQASLLVVLLVSFILGGIFGIFAYRAFPNWSLLLPAVLSGLLGLLYLHYFYRSGKQA